MRKLLLLMLALALLLLGGCMDVEVHLVINADGSGELTHVATIDNAMMEMMELGGDEDVFAELIAQLEAKEFAVTTFAEEGVLGVRGTKHVPAVTPAALAVWGDEVPTSGPGLTVTEDQVSTRFEFDFNYDLRLLEEEEFLEDEFFDPSMLEDYISYVFMVTLPVEPLSHNADSVSADGRTLTWNLKLGEQNPVEFTAVDGYSLVGLAVLGGAALLLLFLLVLIIVLIAKGRRKERVQLNN